MYLYYLLASTLLGGVYYITISDTKAGKYYRKKRRKWKELKKMVSSQYDSTFDIYRVSYKMLLQALYADILKLFDNRVEKKSNKMYELTYYIEGQMFKMPIKVKRGPSAILSATNENDKCVLLDIKHYATPDGKFNNALLTPNYLGYKKIKVETLEADYEFEEDQPIMF